MTRSRSSSSSSSSSQGIASFMEEPSSFRPPTPPPTIASYERRQHGGHSVMLGDATVEVGLVSGHPLWGHLLYPAAIALSQFLELHSFKLLRGDGKGKGKSVLEFGAGGGLPGLVAALEGAGQVVITDFPDPSLVNNLIKNVELNIGNLNGTEGIASTSAIGFTWGASPTPLFENLPPSSKFDLILLSDLVFNHSQHSALLETCLACLSPNLKKAVITNNATEEESIELPPMDLASTEFDTPTVLCFYSHHRPTAELIAADLGLLSLARATGWIVKRVWKDKEAGPAFPEDKGDICIRSTVHGWALSRPEVDE